ncbi:MAG: hypothetical protein IJJ47_11635 [Methanosphaera sp.]|nr:hypothetical protein [Methanosphaera sp.]
MEVNNILDALEMDDVEEVVQLCKCTYDGKCVEFRLVTDDIGVIDEIEFLQDDGTYSSEHENGDDESLALIIEAIEKAPYNVFHKSDVGAKLNLNHASIKEQNVPEHFKTDFYVDEEGPIEFTLVKNIVELD